MSNKIGVTLIVILAVVVLLILGYVWYGQMYPAQPSINQNKQTNPPSSLTLPSSSNPSTSGSSSSTSTPETYNIDISNFVFSPSSLTIKKGDKVVWTNLDSAPHTVTSDSGSELDSSSLSKGTTYSHTFNTAGTYDYHCTIHPSMKAKIIVE
ncbi:MAG: cupredoxin family copper-binding protein [Nanoarchaeota archaeon]